MNPIEAIAATALGRSVAIELDALVAWWWHELRELYAESMAAISPSHSWRATLAVQDGNTLLFAHHAKQRIEPLVLPTVNANEASRSLADQLPATLAQFWPTDRPQRIRAEIALPARSVLVRELSLPSLNNHDLARMIDLRIEREWPLSRRDVYVDWRVVGRDPAGDGSARIRVAIGLVRRADVDAVRVAVERWGWKVTRVGLAGAAADGLQFDFGERSAHAVHGVSHTIDRRLQWTATVLVLAALATPVGQGWYERHQTQALIATSRSQLTRLAKETEKLATADAPALALKALLHSPSAIDVVADLTALVPDETWLHQLDVQMDNNHVATVQLSGYTPAATVLVDLLEKQERIAKVELRSAGSDGVGSNRDRFEVTATWSVTPATGNAAP